MRVHLILFLDFPSSKDEFYLNTYNQEEYTGLNFLPYLTKISYKGIKKNSDSMVRKPKHPAVLFPTWFYPGTGLDQLGTLACPPWSLLTRA